MARRELKDVEVGQIWRDRDPRMWSGNRRVMVIRLDPGAIVIYRQYFSDDTTGREFRSMLPRFQRAFELVGSSASE